MGLPSKKRTRQSKRERWAHIKLTPVTGTLCASCKAPVRPHQACAECGMYRGKAVTDVKKRKVRAMRSNKTKA